MNRILASLLLTTLATTAADWPQWRGPNRDGISKETGLLKSWPEAGPALPWKATGMGVGYSSVAVSKGRIYTMGDVGDAAVVLALDEKTGKILWTTPIGAPYPQDKSRPGTRSTPTVDGDLLFALDPHGNLVCLETATGKERWKKNLSSDFRGQMMSGWRYSESPLVDGEKVLTTPGGPSGAVVALDRKTGATVWQSKAVSDKAGYSTIAPAEILGVKQYVQLTGSSVFGLATGSGDVLWRAERVGKTAVIPTPIVSGAQIYVTSGYGVGCNAFAVAKDSGGFKATELWLDADGSRPMAGNMVNHTGGVILLDGYLYGHSDKGGYTCQNFKTGKTEWSKSVNAKGSVTCAEGMLYFRSDGRAGTVTLVEATPKAYVEKGQFDQPDRSSFNSWAHPVVANGKLYLRDMDVLLCYDVKAK